MSLVLRPLLPPFETAIAGGEDGEEEGSGGGEFECFGCSSKAGSEQIAIVVVDEHQRVLLGLDGHCEDGEDMVDDVKDMEVLMEGRDEGSW